MVKLSNVDFFRKVPTDLTQATRRGGILSIFVASLISIVLFCEVWTYLEGETKSKIILDDNNQSKLDIYFDVSFYELPCRYASVEAWDYLGNAKLDVSAKIRKTVITGDRGEQQKGDFEHRPLPPTEQVAHNDPSKAEPHQVVSLDSATYGKYLKENEYTFVLYYVDVSLFLFFIYVTPVFI